MELPEGWDAELKEIKGPITERANKLASIRKKLLGTLTEAIDASLSEFDMGNPFELEQEAWARIRQTQDIPHPEPKDSFDSDQEAAQVIIHYWLGGEVDEEALLMGVMGYGDMDLWKQAIRFATNLTEQGSPERAFVDQASNFLWRDYKGGHG